MTNITGKISIIFFLDEALAAACQSLATELLSENATYKADRFYVSLYTAELEDVPFELLETVFEVLTPFVNQECTLQEIRISEDRHLEYSIADNDWLPTLHKAVLPLGDYVSQKVKEAVLQELKNPSEAQQKNIELFGTWRALEYLEPAVVLGQDETLTSRPPIENMRSGAVSGFAIVKTGQFGALSEVLIS